MFEKLLGYKFSVAEDPDNPGFFSVYADKDGAGAEVAGKIGEREVAEAIVSALGRLCAEDEIVVLVTHKIDEQRLRDLLCSAWEGGSAYWCRMKERIVPDDLQRELDATKLAGEQAQAPVEPLYSHEYPFLPGVTVTLEDVTGEDSGHGTEWTLTREKLLVGIQKMADVAPQHFANFLSENDDAETGDVYLQLCLFGEIVFG